MSKRLSFGKLELTAGSPLEEASGAVEPQTPFRIAVLGDFSGRAAGGQCSPETIAARRPMLVDRDNFDDVLAKLGVEVPLGLEGGPPVTIGFRGLDDFLPDEIFGRVAVFEKLRDLRRRLADSKTFPSAAAEVQGLVETEPAEAPPETTPEEPASPTAVAPEGLLDQMLEQTAQEITDVDPARVASQWDSLIRRIVSPYYVP
ncbi:MAG: type VI secretion system contractile sheath small subunit, partial [Planctomycetota bacterium]